MREQLGIAPGATEREIPPEVRQKLKSIGIRAGRFALFVPEALKPRAMALRAQIWALIRDIPVPTLPPPGLVALPLRPVAEGEVPPPHMLWPSGFAEAMGWLPAGPVLLRLDVAERIAAELGFLTRRAPAPPPPDLASRLGVKGDMLGTALTALGFRMLDPAPLEEGQYGPPAPLRVAQPRPSHGPPRREAPRRPRPRRAAGRRGRTASAKDARRSRRRKGTAPSSTGRPCRPSCAPRCARPDGKATGGRKASASASRRTSTPGAAASRGGAASAARGRARRRRGAARSPAARRPRPSRRSRGSIRIRPSPSSPT